MNSFIIKKLCIFDYLSFPRFTYVTDYVTSSAPDKIISLIVTVIKLYSICKVKTINKSHNCYGIY